MISPRILIWLLILTAGVYGGYQWFQEQEALLPDYITYGNGRIEAEEVHVAAKYAGRVTQIIPQEGDMVSQGEVIAHIDVQELRAQLSGAMASQASAENMVQEVLAEITLREAELELANKEVARTSALVGSSISQQLHDRNKATAKTAQAALGVSQARLASAQNQVKAVKAEIERINVLIEDASLKAPMSGRVQYRLVEPGEVVGAGSRIVTLLDLENVYMSIYLSTADIGHIQVGSQARIILDAIPDIVIPAQVSFISSEAQFTPRQVETREEREKLMFRVKIRLPRSLLSENIEKVRTGLPGMGYVILNGDHEWPEQLKVNIKSTQTD